MAHTSRIVTPHSREIVVLDSTSRHVVANLDRSSATDVCDLGLLRICANDSFWRVLPAHSCCRWSCGCGCWYCWEAAAWSASSTHMSYGCLRTPTILINTIYLRDQPPLSLTAVIPANLYRAIYTSSMMYEPMHVGTVSIRVGTIIYRPEVSTLVEPIDE